MSCQPASKPFPWKELVVLFVLELLVVVMCGDKGYNTGQTLHVLGLLGLLLLGGGLVQWVASGWPEERQPATWRDWLLTGLLALPAVAMLGWLIWWCCWPH